MVQFIFALSAVLVLVGLTLHYFQAANTSPQDPPSMRSYLRAWLGESLALPCMLLLTPLSWLSRTLQQTSTGSGPPIVVISTSLWGSPAPCMPLQWALWRRGFINVHALALPHARGSLDKIAAHLVGRLQQLESNADGLPIHVITHGSAGLVLRFALTNPQLPQLGRVVTIGCPHQGTMSAVFFSPQTSLLLRPNSPFLQGLPEAPQDWFSIYSEVDPLVIPSQSAQLSTGSEQVAGLGHFQLPLSPKVCHMAAEYLLEGRYQTQPPESLKDSSRFA